MQACRNLCKWFYARAVGYSPDGTRIATPSSSNADSDREGVIQVWNAFDGSPVVTCKAIKENYKALKLAWSPDSKRLASINVGGQLYVWNAATGEEVWDTDILGLGGAWEDPILAACVAWSSAGSRLAYGRAYGGWGDDLLHIADVTHGRDLFTLPCHPFEVAWSPDGGRLACIASERSHLVVGIWDMKTRSRVVVWDKSLSGRPPYNHFSTIAWSPDGSKVVLAADNVNIWDAATGRTLFTYSDGSDSAAWSPDGTRIASASDTTIQVWRTL